MTVLSTKGQVVIPQDVRQELKLSPGARMDVAVIDDSILLIPKPRNPPKALRGLARNSKKAR